MINLTPIARTYFDRIARGTFQWGTSEDVLQLSELEAMLRAAADTEYGRRFGFADIVKADGYELYERFAASVPVIAYEEIRDDVMRMIYGGSDILWPGKCLNFAQSSGTSGGKSKYIPITDISLYCNHYWGARYAVAFYLQNHPKSRFFSGKGMILGGSFSNELADLPADVRVGDLSATLIDKTPAAAEFFRVPDKKIALMANWQTKLEEMTKAVLKTDVTNISGVPSWMLLVLHHVLEVSGKDNLNEVWPDLELFIHGGVSFAPYRAQYEAITDPKKMHFLETYNSSEGFFAVQNDPDDPAMVLLPSSGVFYEFIPFSFGEEENRALPIWEVEVGKEYEMLITAANGLWRYKLGDTVTVQSLNPVKITVAGRTRTFINAFGEELMENNAEKAIARACHATGAAVRNYTAAPLFHDSGNGGVHQWLIEWVNVPESIDDFTDELDAALRELNSDYDAKRSHDMMLSRPQVISAPAGLFERWMYTFGNRKLGGQRKVPRLTNNRDIMEALLDLASNS